MTTPAPSVTLEDIRRAQHLLEDVLEPTPLQHSRALTDRIGADVYLKCENLQRTGSFKMRGAYVRMANLTRAEQQAGVVAASAGNHAQGVALAASLLGIKAKVYMPVGAAMPKLAATRGYGAEVEQVGLTLDESLMAARAYAAQTGAVLIHPFDHADIVAGQGTCGLEILEQCPEVKTIIVAAGGGGLLAGIATAVRRQRPDVRVIGVQAQEAAAYPESLAVGHPVPLSAMATMADGIAVGCPGDVPFGIISQLVERIDTVTEAEISRALLFLVERAKLVVEPAGAVAVARLLRTEGAGLDGPVVAVLSGGNLDPILLLRIIRHGMAAAGRYLQFSVITPDQPGSLATLLTELAATGANVMDVAHERTGAMLDIGDVEIAVEVETKGPEHRGEVLRQLRAAGYRLILR